MPWWSIKARDGPTHIDRGWTQGGAEIGSSWEEWQQQVPVRQRGTIPFRNIQAKCDDAARKPKRRSRFRDEPALDAGGEQRQADLPSRCGAVSWPTPQPARRQ